MKIISAEITGSLIINGSDVTLTVESSSIWSGSIASRVDTLEQFSSSLDANFATDEQLNQATASLSESISILSGSYLTTSASYSAASESISDRVNIVEDNYATTGSNIFTDNQTITGSLNTTGSFELYGDQTTYGNIIAVQKTIAVLGFPTEQPAIYSEGNVIISGSLNLYVEELGQSFDIAESFQSAFSAIDFSQNQIDIISSSYATTGSNTFIGNQTITGSILNSGSLTINGNLTSTGQIIAQTINVQQVTSSIVYSCGDNVFGTALTNTQTLCGNVFNTGSLACFAGRICSNTLSVSSTTNLGGALTGTSATFGGNLNLQGAVTRNINFYDDTCTNINAQIQYDQIASNSGQFFFKTNNAGTLGTKLTIANTGVATFACSVSANKVTINSTSTSFTPLFLNSEGNYASSGNMTTGFAIANTTAGRALNMGVYEACAYAWIQAAYINNADVTFALLLQPKGGNVGIGTTSPQAGLQLEKYGSKFDGDNQYNQPSGNIFLSVTNVIPNQDNWFGIRGSYNSNSGSSNLLLQANYRDVNSQAGHYISSKATNFGVADFEIGKLTTSTSVSTPPTKVPQLYITSDGNVGIGTLSPLTLLQVGCTAVSSGGAQLRVYGFDGAADFYNTREESPFNSTIQLHNNPVSAPGAPGIAFRARSSSTDSRIQAIIYSAWTTSTDASRTSKLVFQTVDSGTASDKVTILGNGNVGIGITNPVYNLDVRQLTTGPVAFFGFSQTSSSSNGLIKLNSGRIPQGGSDFTGESGIIFGHSGGTGGVNFDGQGGYIKSIRLNTYAASGESDSALVFATALDNVDTERMRITSTGIACFACQVCVPTLVAPGLTLLGNYNCSTTLCSCFGDTWVTIIPTNTLGTNSTYVVGVRTNGMGASPYEVASGIIFLPVNTNAQSSFDNEFLGLMSTHQGYGATSNLMYFRSIAGNGQVSSGLQIKLCNFASFGGTLNIRASQLLYS